MLNDHLDKLQADMIEVGTKLSEDPRYIKAKAQLELTKNELEKEYGLDKKVSEYYAYLNKHLQEVD